LKHKQTLVFVVSLNKPNLYSKVCRTHQICQNSI